MSSRGALLADSDARAYRPFHRRDGSAGTQELIYLDFVSWPCHSQRGLRAEWSSRRIDLAAAAAKSARKNLLWAGWSSWRTWVRVILWQAD